MLVKTPPEVGRYFARIIASTCRTHERIAALDPAPLEDSRKPFQLWSVSMRAGSLSPSRSRNYRTGQARNNFGKRLSNEAQALRQPARLTSEGPARESLFRRAHENEATLI
jgi:hypothetical protein